MWREALINDEKKIQTASAEETTEGMTVKKRSIKDIFKEKSLDVVCSILSGLILITISIYAGIFYDSYKVKRLNDDIAYRYFDMISRIIVTNEEGKKTIGKDYAQKMFYVKNIESLSDDVSEVRKNWIFGIEKSLEEKLGALQNFMILIYSNEFYYNSPTSQSFSMLLCKFCNEYSHVYDTDIQSCKGNQCSEKETVFRNAKEICQANIDQCKILNEPAHNIPKPK